jgi:hypothetical protein
VLTCFSEMVRRSFRKCDFPGAQEKLAAIEMSKRFTSLEGGHAV